MTESKPVPKSHSLCSHLLSMPANPYLPVSWLPTHSHTPFPGSSGLQVSCKGTRWSFRKLTEAHFLESPILGSTSYPFPL